MRSDKIIILLLLVLLSTPLFGQSKNEKEERIDRNMFPKVALELLKHLPAKTKRLKYYRETDGEKLSYEAKLKLHKKRYSIEFNNEGILEDIEITISEKEINQSARIQIKTFMNSNYSRFKFLKIQKQYTNNFLIDSRALLNNAISHSHSDKVNYEIVAEVQAESKRILMEFTFGPEGEILSKRLIVPSSYEHMLY
jgi:hypothetical protein